MLSYEGCAGGVIVSTSEIEIVEQSSNSDFVTFTFVQRPLEKAWIYHFPPVSNQIEREKFLTYLDLQPILKVFSEFERNRNSCSSGFVAI